MIRPLLVVAFALALPRTALAGEQTLMFDGEVPAGGLDHVFVDFEVPEGIVEIEVRHDDMSTANILDWGVYDPDGHRGWGGGNSEPAVIGIEAASRSYVPGPIAAGTWRVVIGKAKIPESPATYHLEIVLRTTATLAPQPERAPYESVAPLVDEARWYAGDFHAHSRESGDARPDIAEMATFARGRGLDFVELSDHNVVSQSDFIAAIQPDHPELLLVPGIEFTTYDGHANAIGATVWVDHKIGQPDVTIAAAIAAIHDQGALVSINHPALAIGDFCIGCAWGHEVDPLTIDAVEIATTGLDQAGGLFDEQAIAFWDELCDQGAHAAA
ncbi:MAG TPA: CehA/McbA family metallohydrolase, partial [Nannocystaceae bacterium]|nr:CehA/McbA family metallohydrolase [Nannocystaceae bacterium]